ncbi:phage tail tube protein [Geobacillus thermoleovorans]
MPRVMESKDAISSKEGTLYITIDGKSYEFAEIVKFDATIEYIKADVKRVGARMNGSKNRWSKRKRNMTYYYHRPEIRAMALEYLRTGKAPMFDAMLVNADITSAAGKQTAIIKNIVPDSTLIAKLDGDSDDVERRSVIHI